MNIKELAIIALLCCVVTVSMTACNNSDKKCCEDGNCSCTCSDCTSEKSTTSDSSNNSEDDGLVDTEITYEVTDAVKATKAYKFFEDGMDNTNTKLHIDSDGKEYDYYVFDGEMATHAKGSYADKEHDGADYESIMYTKDKLAYILDVPSKTYYTYDLNDDDIATKKTYMSDLLESMFTYIDYVEEKDGYEVFRFKDTGYDYTIEDAEDTESSETNDVEASVKTTASGAKAENSSYDSTDTSVEASVEESSEDNPNSDLLFMKITDEGVVAESRDANGKVTSKSVYSISKVTDEDKKRCSIEGYTLMSFDEETSDESTEDTGDTDGKTETSGSTDNSTDNSKDTDTSEAVESKSSEE